ncbi:hypothetical protein ACFL26_01805 [Patescibacteria group bacterium]
MKKLLTVSVAIALMACTTAAVQQTQTTTPRSAEAAAVEFDGELATIILEGGLEVTAPRVSWQVHGIEGRATFLNPPLAGWLSVEPADPNFVRAMLSVQDRQITYMCAEEVCAMSFGITSDDENCTAEAMAVSINAAVEDLLDDTMDFSDNAEAAPFDLCRRLAPMSGEYPAQVHLWTVGDELLVRAEYVPGNPNAQIIVADALALVRDLAGSAQPVE